MERELGVRVVGIRRMTGGIVAAVHRLTVEHVPSGRRELVVLRQYEHHGDVEREAVILGQVAGAGLLAPRLLAASATGAGAGGHPALLMTRLPGRADLSPGDPGRWLGQMADMAARIHQAAITLPARDRQDHGPWRPAVPASAARPGSWRALGRALAEPAPPYQQQFTHGDFQHFNLLWSRGRLTGVVDWGSAESGPPDIDVGHCRLNLAQSATRAWEPTWPASPAAIPQHWRHRLLLLQTANQRSGPLPDSDAYMQAAIYPDIIAIAAAELRNGIMAHLGGPE